MRPKIFAAEEVVKLIKDNDTVCIGGAGAGHAVPDTILAALGRRFKATRHPRNLTTFHPCGIGDNATRGLNHLAFEGMIKRDIGGFWGNAPKLTELALAEKIEGYNLPQGVLSHLVRAIAGNKPGVITTTGLHTFVDPRVEGGRINKRTTEQLVEVVNLNGQEYLFYKSFPIDVSIIRGTTLDSEGNITTEEEVGSFAMLSMAQAAKSNKGLVIAQVKQISERPTPPGSVKIPGVFIDYVVVEPEQGMTFLTGYEPALVDRRASFIEDSLELDGIRKIVSRRAALELTQGAFVNLGYGLPDGVPIVARQENILSDLIFMIEQGSIAGVPTTGLNFGAMYNPSAIVDDGYQFDWFHGGGLDVCYLGFAEIDAEGNVNSSRFGKILTGCGGFIDISQATKKVVFCGAFAAKTKVEVHDGKLQLLNRGTVHKLVDKVQQITFNGQYAVEKGQKVLYITERAVFSLTKKGIELIEIAPGLNLHNDILDVMDFIPLISPDLKEMDAVIFSDAPLNLKERFQHEAGLLTPEAVL